MEEARHILGSCGPEIDIIVAREPGGAAPRRQEQEAGGPGRRQEAAPGAPSQGAQGDRRKRRRLPAIDRPQSAPSYNNVVTERTVRPPVEGGDLVKTVITIGEEQEEQEVTCGPPVARAVSVSRRGSRSSEVQHLRPVSKSAERLVEQEQEGMTLSQITKPPQVKMISKIPRRHQVSKHSNIDTNSPQFSGVTVHNVEFEKGPGVRKGLGFSVVGGIDSPRGEREGSLGVVITGVMS